MNTKSWVKSSKCKVFHLSFLFAVDIRCVILYQQQIKTACAYPNTTSSKYKPSRDSTYNETTFHNDITRYLRQNQLLPCQQHEAPIPSTCDQRLVIKAIVKYVHGRMVISRPISIYCRPKTGNLSLRPLVTPNQRSSQRFNVFIRSLD